MTNTTAIRPETLLGDHVAPHVDEADVDVFMRLAQAGAVPGRMMPNCAAVQDNVTLRHDTRTTLSAE